MAYITWKKGSRFRLSDSFVSTEFECRCHNESCVEQKINTALVDNLQEVRNARDTPITIINGFRCKAYQKELKDRGYQTATNSTHLLGDAADITARDLDALLKECEKRFKAIGVGKTFLHVDERKDKERRWEY